MHPDVIKQAFTMFKWLHDMNTADKYKARGILSLFTLVISALTAEESVEEAKEEVTRLTKKLKKAQFHLTK